MQTRKSGNLASNNSSSSGANLWQSTTLGALSRQQKGQNALSSKSIKNDGKMVNQSSPLKREAVNQQSNAQDNGDQQVFGLRSPVGKKSTNSSNMPNKHQSEGICCKNTLQQEIVVKAHLVNAFTTSASINKSAGSKMNDRQTTKALLEQKGVTTAFYTSNRQAEPRTTTSHDPKKGGKAADQDGVTQIQTHTGTGPQQNLFIKNLFFIHSGSRNNSESIGGGSSTRNYPNRQQIFESAPVTSKAAERSEEMFTEQVSKQARISEKLNQSSPQKTTQGGGFQMYNDPNRESNQKAINIATSVLQQLVPLTSNTQQIQVLPTNDDQQPVSNSLNSLKLAVQQTQISNTSLMKQGGVSSQGGPIFHHAKSLSPVKRSASTKEELKSLEVATKIINVDDSQEISLFSDERGKSREKKPSYGEMPKYGTKKGKPQLKATSVISPQKNSTKGANNLLKVGNTNSRNTGGEVFSYKMKTVNINDKSQGLLKSVSTSRNNHEHIYTATSQINLAIDNQSDRSSFQERNLSNSRINSGVEKHQAITKSQSQQQFNLGKRPKHVSDDFLKMDGIYTSIGNLSIKNQQKSVQPHDSWVGEPSNIRYESAIGDKQSEISSNIDKADKQSIRVMARFRPFNTIEKELQELYPQRGDIIAYNEDNKTVKIQEEFHTQSNNLNFTFDHVFKPDTSQAEVFERVGAQMIEDILYGYNGTIFAYGQTGSGKTFTMYGDDMFDEVKMGLIPRAARQIFDHIRQQDLEVEYTIRVQMIEIYKETLRDLLHNSPERAPDLKIKEDPKRGTYVEGLQDICIVNEEEIMAVICTGETMRHVASTQLNQVSSRSHAICMIEIISKYPNDSERRGVLNLVDLAGSERVSRSMAQGPALEEAKKINFSLSMLGKVINSLVKNSPHIPYRDSKLTRLLKESLGGNNKTSLIVACSPHHSNFEETLSSLRFAQSAKFIQNKVKLNIKTSNLQLQNIIEQLKIELKCAKEEIQRLRICSDNQSQIQQNNLNQTNSSDKMEDEAYKTIAVKNVDPNQSLVAQPPLQAIHNLPHQSLLAKNYEIIETNNHQSMQLLSLLAHDLTHFPLATHPSTTSLPGTKPPLCCMDPLHPKLLENLVRANEELDMKLRSKEQDLEAITFQKDELQLKVQSMEEKVGGYRHRLMNLEKRLSEYEGEKEFMSGKEVTQSHKMRHYENQIKQLGEQVKMMEKAMAEYEQKNKEAMKDREIAIKTKVSELLEQTFEVMKIPMNAALQNIMNKESEEMKEVKIEYEIGRFEQTTQKIALGERDLLMQNLYSLELTNSLQDGTIPPEMTIYLLKHQLIDACLANHNLQRCLSVQHWRYQIDADKLKAKDQLCSNQEATIGTLEDILERTKRAHDKLKSRVDKLENQLNQNQRLQQVQAEMAAAMWTDAISGGSIGGEGGFTQRAGTLQFFETLNRSSSIPLNNIHTQSIVSGSVYNNTIGQPIINSKTRFTRTINSKLVKRMFNNKNEKSPGSRPSLGNGSVVGKIPHTTSIMSQYYGMKQGQLFAIARPQLSQIDSNTQGGGSGGSSSQHQAIKVTDSQEGDEFQRDDDYQQEKLQIPIRSRAVSLHNNNMFSLNAEDLKKIDQSNNLQDVKDYLRGKFDQMDRLQKGASRIQNSEGRVQKEGQSPPHTAQRIDTITCGSNLYKASETSEIQRENEALAAIPTSINPNLVLETSVNQDGPMTNRHDALMFTMGSDSLGSLVMNPIHTPGGAQTFNAAIARQSLVGTHFFPPGTEVLDRLQDKIIQLQEESDLQKCRADELKKVCQDSKKQLADLRSELTSKDLQFASMLRDEIYQWEQALNQMKRINECELQKKQREVERLNELLAKWIESYQRAEMKNQMESLVKETMRQRRSNVGNQQQYMLTEVMLSPTPNNRPSVSMSFAQMKSNATGILPSRMPSMMINMKSPQVENSYYLQTPMTKPSAYQPLQTEGLVLRASQHVTSSGGLPLHAGQIATQPSCASPILNILMSEKQEQLGIRGDVSPPHHHNSSFDDDLSLEDHPKPKEERLQIDLTNSPNQLRVVKEGNTSIRMNKTVLQQLSRVSLPSELASMKQSAEKGHTFIEQQAAAEQLSESTSRIEWNMLHSQGSDRMSNGDRRSSMNGPQQRHNQM